MDSRIDVLKNTNPKFNINPNLEIELLALSKKSIREVMQTIDSDDFFNLMYAVSGEVLSNIFSSIHWRRRNRFMNNYENLCHSYHKERIIEIQNRLLIQLRIMKEIEQTMEFN